MEEVLNHSKSSDTVNVFEYPFVSNSDTIEYVRYSKLMVLANSSKLFPVITRIYGNDSSCISNSDVRKKLNQTKQACEAGQHIVAVNSFYENVSLLESYPSLAKEDNYLMMLTGEPQDLLPSYVGWHLNEADSCMLGLVAHTHLEDLLQKVPEFCSDFRNFSHSDTIREMLKFYQLASSNYHGMLHCTAKYFGSDPSEEGKDYFKGAKPSLSQFYNNSVIGFVFTPRTFGARVKLTQSQLELWGGDEDNSTLTNSRQLLSNFSPISSSSTEESSTQNSCESVLSLCSDLEAQCISSDNATLSRPLKDSPRRFPHCQASLVCISANEEPNFRPVTGRGCRAHMTLGVAAGVSAVTTGYDVLEIVQCESETKDWPTYETSQGWLRDYGEGRWALYPKKHIQVGSLFTGVYNFTSSSSE